MSWRNHFHTLDITLRATARRGYFQPGFREKNPVHLFLAITDHFEPQVHRRGQNIARRRLEQWLQEYPLIAARHQDYDGRSPAHSFFYPWDEYDEWEFSHLMELCAAGWGEIEIHLHHRDDTEVSLRQKIREGIETYRAHGALSTWPSGRPAWGFIHGNFALANSRCEGDANFCGVNNELAILEQEGCYADFTFPAWKSMSQPRQLNSIYYAAGDPACPKCYDRGVPAQHMSPRHSGVILVQGPLVPHLKPARGGLFRPAMDDGTLTAKLGYSAERLDRWVQARVHVQGRPDWLFIKLSCHGAEDGDREALLSRDLDALFSDAEARYNDGERFRLHYVTAREMYNLIAAAEAGLDGEPGELRDWMIPPPRSPSYQGREAGLAG
ncbi:hypothetical protein DC522_32370 [Microvirga sp. KLBC 81]|uniref:hypothetical protein n=1 Tax=Microvirga sp. KLBC 81 TaxID=1862707 RepID=UPI000D509BB5|nr:hypothetical protein [Microvirga sp. KLBC 81]PVE20438.1 hypothetical protein DC522_32370 [Microvirga sp. KLBC 81]